MDFAFITYNKVVFKQKVLLLYYTNLRLSDQGSNQFIALTSYTNADNQIQPKPITYETDPRKARNVLVGNRLSNPLQSILRPFVLTLQKVPITFVDFIDKYFKHIKLSETICRRAYLTKTG